MSEKLLPCPFCGSTAETSGGGTHVEVGCSNPKCFVSMVDIQIDRLIAAWNTRATDSLPTYYLLRRTVGVTTIHHQYLAHGHMWLSEITHKSFWYKADAELFASDFNERGDGPHVEIIPIKLLEVPHES